MSGAAGGPALRFRAGGRLMAYRIDEDGCAVRVPCRCLTGGAPSCVDACETCEGLGAHRLEVRAGAVRCLACSFSRPLTSEATW